MGALNRKLLRDLVRLWPQVLAIALVLAAGAATLILAAGARDSLYQTRQAYYDQHRFAHVFASLTRAPTALAARLAEIPGVAAVETRISKIALVDVADMREPGSMRFVSLPDIGEQALNTLYLRTGRWPTRGSTSEVIVNAPFAEAHGLRPGDRFTANLNGRQRVLTITGIALSPEFIYVIGPWDLMPDDRRFGVGWMSESALAGAYDLEGAFSDVALRLRRDASEAAVIAELDTLLARHGGQGAYARRDQVSHAFLDAELDQLATLAAFLPPVFLLVAAFLVNMTLARLVQLEREQIGLLKALGYTNWAIGRHYLGFVALIAALGVVIGSVAGTWLGSALTRLYGAYFQFPFLVFTRDPAIYLVAGAAAFGAACLGAVLAVRRVVRLAPAVAMAPPAPPRFSRLGGGALAAIEAIPRPLVMVVRNLTHAPVRSLSVVLGVGLGVTILVGSLWVLPAMDHVIDVTFLRQQRQDASINFGEPKRMAALHEVARLPGVLEVEPYRVIAATLRKGTAERRTGLTGKPRGASLSRVLDLQLLPVDPPDEGVALTDMLANLLDARVGDLIEVELMEGDRRTLLLPVTQVIPGYLGLAAYVDIGEANRLMREGALVTGAHLTFDRAEADAFFAAVKGIPAASFIGLQYVSAARFRENLDQNLMTMVSIYGALAAIIAFGVVYNSARIALSERGRDLASLRVLGFTRGEVSAILLGELAILVVLAQPVGWLLGYGLAQALSAAFATELYRVPLVVPRETFAWASLIVLAAAAISALAVRRRIDRLDLIEVLKTRE